MNSKTLLNATDMSKTLGITRESFLKGVKSGRFTKAKTGKSGPPFFDPSVVKKEYADTRAAAELQDHARMLPSGMRGGRPKKAAKKASDGKVAAEKPSDTISQQQILKVKLEKEKAQTKTLDLKYKIQKGEYIEKEDARRHGVELGELVIGAMQAWASRLAPELAAMIDCDEHDFHQRLEREVNDLIIAIRQRCGREERG
jgi:hypothetical protein